MRQIVKDWIDFCEKGTAFEDGYFYTLFMEKITSIEIREIYKYFPNSDLLIERMEKFLFESPPKVQNIESRKLELERLIKLDFVERAPVMNRLSIFSNLLPNLNFVFVFRK